jgi:transcriptional regulator with XRE-family HTH domain/tetratricopeptide (TPR) repeat protein
MSFGGLLRTLRTAAGLTQEELAEAARVSYRSISDLERGVSRSPRRDTARLLADALGLSGAGRAGFEAAARGRPSAEGTAASLAGAVTPVLLDVLAPAHAGAISGDVSIYGSPQARPAPVPVRAWGNVPARNPSFTGREEQLAGIRRALAGEGGRAAVQALHGMGGVGKTQLAIEYAHRHSGDYDVTWWLDSENTTLMTQQYADLAAERAAQKGLPQEAMRRALLSHLHRRPRWLLIFDNAEDPAFLRDWLPSGPGHVIITSRSQNWAELAAPVLVDVLPRHESVDLLGARVPGIMTAEAEILAEALGDLPLALAQAAAYLAETRMPAGGYTQILRDRAATLLSKGKPLTYRATLSAATTLAYDRLRATDKDAATLASICAFLAPEPVPAGWLVTAAGNLPGGLRARLADPLERDDLMAALTRTSLARLNDDGLIMHRLTQAILRARPAEPDEIRAHAEALVTANTPEVTEAPDTWPTWGRLLPHILALEPEHSGNPRLQMAVVQAAAYLMDAGKAADALSLAARVHRVWHDRLGPSDRQTLRISHAVASAHRLLGHFGRARQLGEDILGRSRRLYGDDDPDTLTVENNVALALYSLGDYNAARELHEHALQHLRRILGDDHYLTLASAVNLARDLHALGDYRAARGLSQDSLQRCRRVLGDDYIATVESAHNVGSALRELGDHQAARALHEDTLKRSRRVHGNDHPVTLAIASDLAADLRALGDYHAARALDEDTLKRSRRVLGDDHPGTLRRAENLTEDLRALGETQ